VVQADLIRAVEGELRAEPQDETRATMAPLLDKQDGRIAWDRPAKGVHDHVRGMTSWPGAFTSADGKMLKLHASRIAAPGGILAAPGMIVRADKHAVIVACASGSVEIVRAQLEGRKPLDAPALVAGRALREGMVLGS